MDKVLVIDDEEAICKYLSRLISRLGYAVDTAMTAADGLKCIGEGGCSLIVSDIGLPDAPAPQRWIEQLHEAAGSLPIVLISGAPSNELSEFAASHGVFTFLSKPFELAFIKNTLQTVLGK